MAKKLASRTAQMVMEADFTFSFNEWVVDSADGAKKTFGSTPALSTDPLESGLTGAAAATIVFDAVPLPRGAVICGGEVIVETPFVGPTAATLNVGISGNAAALASAVDLKAAAGTRTALTLTTTALLCNDGTKDVRITPAYTVANATAGKARVRVLYTVDGRANENSL